MDRAGGPGRRLLYYDQRGGGRSRLPGDFVGMAGHVADLEAIRQHLGQERLTLCGYSFGGLLALLYADAHPAHVERLALISPAAADAAGRAEMKARLARAAERPEVRAFQAGLDRGDRRQRFAGAVAGYFVDPRRALELTPFVVQQGAEQAVWRSLGDYDLLPRLSGIDRPALVLHGREDPIPLETARATAAALGADLIELPRCGHVPYVEAPEPLFDALDRFLSGS
jgi:proline iminopeptidase